MEKEQDETTAKKNFSSLPPQLRELVLPKTDSLTRLKLFQINNELREWVLERELFGEDLNEIYLEGTSEVRLVSRYDRWQKIDLSNQYVFQVVRRCRRLYLDNRGLNLDLRSIFPRLQSVNYLRFWPTIFPRLLEWFKSSDVKITGFYSFHGFCEWRADWTSKIDENFFQFIENHLKRCKHVDFGRYPLKKLFECLRTQHIPQVEFKYWKYGWHEDLEMILKNGIPSLHPDPELQMVIVAGERFGDEVGILPPVFTQIFDFISERASAEMGNEAIDKKFFVPDEQVGGFLDDRNRKLFGLQTKFDEKRNLVFLVYEAVENISGNNISIRIKFDPTEK